MDKTELVVSTLESLGYVPQADDDRGIFFPFQMKTIYVILGEEDETYLSVVLSHFAEIGEGEDAFVLAVCNKVTRNLKLGKVYVDQTCKWVSAACEFFYTDERCLRESLEFSLEVLGIVRSVFRKVKDDFLKNTMN